MGRDHLSFHLASCLTYLSCLKRTRTLTRLTYRDPYRLCAFLLAECQARGVILHHPARATQLTSANSSGGADEQKQTTVRIEYLDHDGQDTDGRDAHNHTGEHRTVTPNSVCPPHDAGVRREDSSRGALKATNGEDKIKAKSEGGDRGMSTGTGTKGMSTAGSMARSSPAPPSETASDPSPPTRGEWASFAWPSEAADAHATGNSNGTDPKGGRGRRRRTVDIPCDSIVIAAGCWTPRVYRTLFPNAGRIPRVTALAGHSLVVRSPSTGAGGRSAPNSASATPVQKTASLHGGHENANGHNKQSAETTTDKKTSKKSEPVCHAIFTGDPAGYSPEIFSRANGDIWLGGLNSPSLPLPAFPPVDSAPEFASVPPALLNTARALLSFPRSSSSSSSSPSRSPSSPSRSPSRSSPLNIIRSSLCFRPVAPTGRPVLARMHAADLGDGAQVRGGVWVATGHGPWGISLSLGTGRVVAEMVLGRETSVDVRALGRWEAQAP